jgi:hypothetical protein
MEDFEKRFKQDVEVPEVVMHKANVAFSRIEREDKMNMERKNRTSNYFSRKAVAAAAIGILAMGSVTAIAATHHIWSRGMQGNLQATDEQRQALTEQGVASVMQEQEAYAQLAVTDGNVTIAPETVIADERFAYLSFSVSGYTLGEGVEPCFESVNVCQENRDAVDSGMSMSGSFYDGIIADENGSPTYDDGSELEDNEAGETIAHYADADGNLEYVILAMVSDEDDALTGKTIHVDFTNLGTVYKADYENAVDGSWSFDIELPDVSAAQTMQIGQDIPGTVFTLENIELSPISMKLNYSVNGDVAVSEDENGVPDFCGVVLKDGTRIPYLANGGATGYTDETKKEAYEWSGFDRVIDAEQVEALLIRTEGNGELVEVSVP